MIQYSLEKWSKAYSILLLLSLVIFLQTDGIQWIGYATIVAFVVFFIQHFTYWKTISIWLGGAANLVTLFRLMLLISLVWIYPMLTLLQIALIGASVLALDGVDGFLARRFKTASTFGAYFDMETDAFYVFLYACLIYQLDLAGGWILAIGALRYGYVVFVLSFFKPKEKEEKSSFRGKAIAVFLMGALLSPFVLIESIYLPILIAASIAVVYSFVAGFLDTIR